MKQVLLAVLCAVIYGCAVDENGIGYSEKNAEYKWGEWENKRLISIADDSLAILAIHKDYSKKWNECGFEGCTSRTQTSDSRTGLFLVNYREKQKPIWGDTLDYDLRIIKDYFRDSSVFVFDAKNNKFGFWKIGTKEVEFMDYSGYYEGKEYRGSIFHNARPWANGNILLFFKGEDPKLLFEVGNRQLRPFEFSGEYEWLSRCGNSRKKIERVYDAQLQQSYYDYKYDYVNISYIGGELVCIKANETADNFEFTVNDVVKDTSSLSKTDTERITGWFGNYVRDELAKIYKIDTLNFKFDSTYAPMWIHDDSYPRFYNNVYNSSPVEYSIQDLLGVFD